MKVVKHCLVTVDKWGPRLFGGLVRYERIHVYYQGFCTYTLELIIQCVSKDKYTDVHNTVKACHQFRDPVTGKTHPRLPYLLPLTHLTAERRVRAIFYWAHALGLQAEVIIEPMREHVQYAVAYLQLILIATRGHRAYTSHELQTIFHDVGRQFFVHLEKIAEYFAQKRVERLQRLHDRNPIKYKAPVTFRPLARFVICRRVFKHIYKHLVDVH